MKTEEPSCQKLKTSMQVTNELTAKLPASLLKDAKITTEKPDKAKYAWVWVKFSTKPSAKDLEQLKRGPVDPATGEPDGSGIGMRWNRARMSWYHTCEDPRKWFFSSKRKRKKTSEARPYVERNSVPAAKQAKASAFRRKLPPL